MFRGGKHEWSCVAWGCLRGHLPRNPEPKFKICLHVIPITSNGSDMKDLFSGVRRDVIQIWVFSPLKNYLQKRFSFSNLFGRPYRIVDYLLLAGLVWEKNTVSGWKFTIVYEQANRLTITQHGLEMAVFIGQICYLLSHSGLGRYQVIWLV